MVRRLGARHSDSCRYLAHLGTVRLLRRVQPGRRPGVAGYLAIDQGPMVPMIENHRTGLPWKMFMKSDVAKAILEKLAEARPAAKQP